MYIRLRAQTAFALSYCLIAHTVTGDKLSCLLNGTNESLAARVDS